MTPKAGLIRFENKKKIRTPVANGSKIRLPSNQ
jgi:hypothetical protein